MIISIIKKYILQNKITFFINLISFLLIIFSIVFSHFLYINIKQNLINDTFGNNSKKFIIQSNPENILKGLFLKQKTLKDIYKELQKDRNISKIFGIYSVNLPISAEILFGPLNFKTDIFLFSSDEGNLCFSGKYIALGINPTIINLYNLQVANPPLFPKINPTILSKLNIVLTFGKNSFINNSKSITKKAKIVLTDQDLPLLGLTIGYKVAQEIINKLGIGDQKLIKIIGYVKDISYLKKIKQKYPNFKVITVFDIKKQLYNKLENIEKIFKFIDLFILILSLGFIVNLGINLVNKYQTAIKVLYYNKIGKIRGFLFILGEILIYFLFSLFAIGGFILYLNFNINKINHLLINSGYYFSVSGINSLYFLKTILTLFLIVILIAFMFFYIKFNEKS